MVCTELDVPKVLPVDVLEFCISKKYEACALAVSGIGLLSSIMVSCAWVLRTAACKLHQTASNICCTTKGKLRDRMFSPTVALHWQDGLDSQLAHSQAGALKSLATWTTINLCI